MNIYSRCHHVIDSSIGPLSLVESELVSERKGEVRGHEVAQQHADYDESVRKDELTETRSGEMGNLKCESGPFEGRQSVCGTQAGRHKRKVDSSADDQHKEQGYEYDRVGAFSVA